MSDNENSFESFEEGKKITRSLEKITQDDLVLIGDLAQRAIDGLFSRAEYSRTFQRAAPIVVLAQGAASHFLDGKTGVKDFDVWYFFPILDGKQFPPRWRGIADFGPSRFGSASDDEVTEGRRIDVMGRSIKNIERDGTKAVLAWLAGGTPSANFLRQKAMIGISPDELHGQVIWRGNNR